MTSRAPHVTAGHAGLADLASLALQLAPQPGLAASLADQVPDYSVPLAALAATVTSQQVTHYRACMIDGDKNTVILLAMALNYLSVRLSGLGRREEALAAGEEATNTWRELAAARLDRFRADLASSLHNLSNDLADLGRREEALAAIEEAIDIRREQARARPDAFGPDLAGSLHNLSVQLSGLGRREEALAAIEEAVTIRRELAARWPAAYRHELEQSLRVVARLEHDEDLGDASSGEPKE